MRTRSDKRHTSPVRVEVQSPDESHLSGDPGDSMWPLTSAGAEAAEAEREDVPACTEYPSVPCTLSDEDQDTGACSGWVAEPLN